MAARDKRQEPWLHRLARRAGLVRMVRFYQGSLQATHKLNAGGRLLFRIRHSAWYSFVVGLLAVISAGTSLYPFGPVIVAATVFSPGRWRGVIVGSSLGAALGGTCFIVLLQMYGPGAIDGLFPDIRQNALWASSAYWIGRHGGIALAVIAAMPVPQMPALILSALGQMSPLSVVLALLVGKSLKYTVYVLAVMLVLRSMRRLARWEEVATDE